MFSWLRGKKHLNLYVLSVYVWLGDKILRRLTAVCKDDSLMLNQTGTNLVPRTWICGFSIWTSKNFIDLPFSSERENKFPWTWDESYLFVSSRVVSILNSEQPKKNMKISYVTSDDVWNMIILKCYPWTECITCVQTWALFLMNEIFRYQSYAGKTMYLHWPAPPWKQRQ